MKLILFRKKLYYLLFSLKNYGVFNGFKLWFDFEFLEKEVFKIPNIKYSIKLRKGTSDKYAFRQIFYLNEYELYDFKNINTIIDAGSNIGLFAVTAKNKFPESKIVCIEPEESNFNTLVQNTKNYSDIYCENKGLWSKNSKLSIKRLEHLGEWGTQVVEDENGELDAISIDYIVEKYKIDTIDILKIDIETSEKYLFNDNFDWILKSRFIIIEFHDRIVPKTSVGFFRALAKLNVDFNYHIMGDNTVIENLSFGR